MEPFIGQIKTFPYPFAPRDWALCDGSLLQIQKYPELFTLIGNVYGGDGRQIFALPNLIGAEPNPHVRYYIALEGIYPQRS